MTRILQINITANWGSHGKIAEGIGSLVQEKGWESYVAYGRHHKASSSQLYHIGNMADEYLHILSSRILDNQGLMSHMATHNLIKFMRRIQPDIVHLHNIHGYYLNYSMLFRFLAQQNIPVVWTLHDCWPFTGRCAHYMFAACDKWKSHCCHCPQKGTYPKTIGLDRSQHNFNLKRNAFLSVGNLTLVPVSEWLRNELRSSFFSNTDTVKINNGIDTDVFKPSHNYGDTLQSLGIDSTRKIVLGVASNWFYKGLKDFLKLRPMLDERYHFVLVGLNKKEIGSLPEGVTGMERTDNIGQLIDLYSAADVFYNPSWEDNFPTTILESMACGTPVVTFDTGGCGEAVAPGTGYVVTKGDNSRAAQHIEAICAKDKGDYINICRENIVNNYNKNERLREYISLYERILG